MTNPRFKFLKLSKTDLEELDFTICSQKRKIMSLIDLCSDNKDIKCYLESLDNLSKIQEKLRKEIIHQ